MPQHHRQAPRALPLTCPVPRPRARRRTKQSSQLSRLLPSVARCLVQGTLVAFLAKQQHSPDKSASRSARQEAADHSKPPQLLRRGSSVGVTLLVISLLDEVFKYVAHRRQERTGRQSAAGSQMSSESFEETPARQAHGCSRATTRSNVMRRRVNHDCSDNASLLHCTTTETPQRSERNHASRRSKMPDLIELVAALEALRLTLEETQSILGNGARPSQATKH